MIMHSQVRSPERGVNWTWAVMGSLMVHFAVISILPMLKTGKVMPEPEVTKVRIMITDKKPVMTEPERESPAKTKAVKKNPAPEKAKAPKSQPVSAQVLEKAPGVQAKAPAQIQHHPAVKNRAVLKDRSHRKPKTGQARIQPVIPEAFSTSKTGPQPRSGAKAVSHFDRYSNASVMPSSIKPVEKGDWQPGGLSDEERREILGPFVRGVREKIMGHKVYPDFARERGYEGRAIVTFELARDGRLVRLSVAQSSGYEALDEAAVKAIREGSPYEAIPAKLQDTSLSFRLPVSFFME